MSYQEFFEMAARQYRDDPVGYAQRMARDPRLLATVKATAQLIDYARPEAPVCNPLNIRGGETIDDGPASPQEQP